MSEKCQLMSGKALILSLNPFYGHSYFIGNCGCSGEISKRSISRGAAFRSRPRCERANDATLALRSFKRRFDPDSGSYTCYPILSGGNRRKPIFEHSADHSHFTKGKRSTQLCRTTAGSPAKGRI